MPEKVRLREGLTKATLRCGDDLFNLIKDKLEEEIVLPRNESVERTSSFLNALANPIRLKIIHLLSQMEMPVCLIASLLGLEQSLVSHHLAILRREGIVSIKIVGKYRFYSLNRSKLVNCIVDLIK